MRSPVSLTCRDPAVLGFLACGAVVRRDAYLAVGGFHEVLGVGGEEELLALDLARAGWGLAYFDDVVAHHHPSAVRDPRARRRRHGANRVLVTWLRRPGRVVLRRTAAAVLAGRESRLGVLDALAVLPVVLRERRVIAAGLESRVRLLEASDDRPAAGHPGAPPARVGPSHESGWPASSRWR